MSDGSFTGDDYGDAKSGRFSEAESRPDWNWILRQMEREIVETLDLESVLALAVDAALRTTGAHDAAVALYEPPDLMRIVHCAGENYSTGIFPLRLNQGGIVGRAVQTRQSIFVADVTTDPDYIAFISRTQAQIVLPLLWRGELLGVLNLETSEPSRFTEESFQFLRQFMDRVALAVDNARAHQTMRRQVAEMRDLYERVRGLERMKSTLLDVAAHDLRNPIGAIRNLTEMILLDEAMSAERRRDMLQSVVSAASDAMRIIEDLLVLQRVENGGKDATFRALDLNTVMRAVVEKKSLEAANFRQQVETTMPGAPTIILGEPALLREAFGNLLDNAIKYTPEGGHLTVSLLAQEEVALFAVRDTGCGISVEEQALIFDPFYRSSSGVERGIAGTGLGLHIVRQIVEQHGGEVSVFSTLNEGSTFTVTLPLLATLKRL